MFFKCKITDFATMKANDDVEQLFFLDKSNINPNLFGLTSIKNAIEKWLTY
ncbi:hypothetical protein M2138_001148 [Dysgonomonadaceae bacterium PH5-43]|nr:hypothetical protein [Dysgonomonadaceae bacterium PH5-43]